MNLLIKLRDRAVSYPLVARWLEGKGLPRRVHLLLGLFVPMYFLCVNMWRCHWFTYDDAYISFRYAVNLVDGYGLVYNPGEAIEGYTNFLWTVIIAAGLKVGVDPHVSSKVLGAASALGTMAVVYRLSNRLSPYGTLPCIATWLLASSSTFSGYAVFGLETNAFIFLMMLGTLMMFEEHDRGRGFPWSGVVFALGGLTRPEAPMFIGVPMLLLGKKFFSKQNLIRGVVFAAPLVAHMLWRYSYYGSFLPSTLDAKTGDLRAQYKSGRAYTMAWADHAGSVVWLGFYGLALGVVRRKRELLTVAAMFWAMVCYVLLVGGDWMSYYRYLAPAEPYAFLLVCVAAREIVQTHNKAAILALGLFGLWVTSERYQNLGDAQEVWVQDEKRFWDNAAGQSAEVLLSTGRPGTVAIGDIGYVGYRTNYPILDLLGLVDPVINQLPGGYTKKHGKGYKERFFDVMPEYAVIILAGQNCDRAGLKSSKVIFNDKKFRNNYELLQNIQVISDASWCVFKRRDF